METCVKVPQMNTVLDSLSLVSWNVSGLGHPVKRGKVYTNLKLLKADAIFLQRTNGKAIQNRKLRTNWVSQVCHSPFTSKAKGCPFCFENLCPFIFTRQQLTIMAVFLL